MITYDPNIRPELLCTQAEARSIFEDLVPLTNVVKLTGGTDGLAPSQPTTIGHTAAMAAAITVGRAGASPPTAEELEAALTAPAASSAGIAGMALPCGTGAGAPSGA